MAAMLIEIKSRMLLPRPPKASRNGRAGRSACRAGAPAARIRADEGRRGQARCHAAGERDYEWVTVWIADKVVERLPEVSLHDLQLAWLR
jgi:segregation and condensation protein A